MKAFPWSWLGAVSLAVGAAGCPLEMDDDAAETMNPSDSTGEVALARIEGLLERLETAPLAPDGDGIGTAYIGAFASCDLAAPLLGVAILPQTDLSEVGRTVPFAIEDLDASVVYLGAFLDDNDDAEPPLPKPNGGDPSLADDVDDGILTCLEVPLVRGETAFAEVWLNLTHIDPPTGHVYASTGVPNRPLR